MSLKKMLSSPRGQGTNPFNEVPLIEPSSATEDVCAKRAQAYPRTFYILNTFTVKWLLDWAGLLTFYTLLGSVPFAVASGAALFAGAVAMGFTHVRSLLDALVSSPKILDVGFLVTFACFTAVGCISADVAIGESAREFPLLARTSHPHFLTGFFLSRAVTQCWSNFLMDFALGVIVVVGVAMGDPFIKPYAIEAGLPAALADTPFAIVLLSASSMEWAYCFFAMAAVSVPAPVYRCASVGCAGATNGTYATINAVFTYGAQYCILGGMMFKDFYLEPRHAKAVQAWVDRAPADYVAAHGAPHGADGAERRVETKKGGATLATLRDDRAGGTDADVATAAKTLAAAFVDDPLMALWVTRAGQAPAPWSDPAGRGARIAAMEKMFACTTRATRRFNHVFVVNGGASYCVCVPCWPEADAMERVNSNESYGTHKWPTECGMPPVEFMQIEKLMTRALGGREHLYIFHVGTDPASQGQGLGSVCMRAALRVADARGVPTALETMTNKNRALYEHFGFKVVGQIEVPECQDPWYGMIREPPADATTVTVNAPLHA